MLEEQRLTISVDTRLLKVLGLILLAHFSLLLLNSPSWVAPGNSADPARPIQLTELPLKARQIRTLGVKNGSRKNSVLVTPKEAPSRPRLPIDPFKAAAAMNQPQLRPTAPVPQRTAPGLRSTPTPGQNPYRRPAPRASALEQLARSARPVQEVATTVQTGGQAQLVNSPTLSKTAINMQVEVPEGVAADELNEYELMFYGFQKRMMEKYLAAIMVQVRHYERTHPQRSLVPEGRHIMTGRVTFDTKGNIKQIKMVRWSQAQGLQNMFEDVLKAMDSVPNPPRQLWEKQGEFTVFYNLTVNNG